ncbi:lipopolysaccharide biosynthesis protein RfbH [Candidatus Actinomarina sp.]|nr:lipopolysaccharide biosynthesis protein RfbH [Candidatus Actinomarina sp.]
MDENLNKLENQILELSKEYFDEVNKNNSFVPYISKVPVAGRVLDSEDQEILIKSSLEMWLTAGRFTEEFEKNLREFTGIRHALFVNSGSSANLLAISALKIFYKLNDGDEVITSAVNFPTTLNPIIQNNLTPVLVDAEKGSFNIDANQIKKKINSKTKGIVLAHTLGNPFNLNKIKEICEDHNLFLMEDMCDAFGSTYDGKMVGQFGDVSTLSFYPAHHITTGEGGAVLTNKPKLKKIIESLRDWGRDCYCPPGQDNTCKKRYDWQLGGLPHGYDHKYIYSHVGYNLKSTDMQAALGVSQLKKLPEFIKSRKKNFNYLFEAFSEFDDFELPIWEEQSDPSWFGFPISVKSSAKFSRNDLVKYYDENNIGTRLLFAGNIVLQPAYMELNMGKPEEFPVANSVVENTFWLGVYPGLTTEHLDFVIKITREFISNNKFT